MKFTIEITKEDADIHSRNVSNRIARYEQEIALWAESLVIYLKKPQHQQDSYEQKETKEEWLKRNPVPKLNLPSLLPHI